eukprot:m.189715 g.189715  ORF g.189715 m.189715 type:complete len:624 (-) comp17552_c2_seq1:2500-4371(-)
MWSAGCRRVVASSTARQLLARGAARSYSSDTAAHGSGLSTSAWAAIAGVSITVAAVAGYRSKRAGHEPVSSSKPEEKAKAPVKEVAPVTPPPPPPAVTSEYVIVGSGTSAHFAMLGILSHDAKAKILIIGDEPDRPYQRPPLSKQLWMNREDGPEYQFKDWTGEVRSVYHMNAEVYSNIQALEKDDGTVPRVFLLPNKKVVGMNIGQRFLTLDDGRVVHFKKVLLATGGSPKNIPQLDGADKKVKDRTLLFRNLSDFRKLESVVGKDKSIAVIGGGFLGSELAVAVAHKGKDSNLKVTQLIAESGNLAKVLPEYLSNWVTEKIRGYGVDVKSGSKVTSATSDGKQVTLTLDNGEKVTADHVLVAVGISPNIELAKQARLEIDPKLGGIVVNSELEARSGVFAAGDVCSFYDISLGRRREEHHDHAVVSGRLAGENMAGAGKPYWHQSLFWSDIGPDVSFEAIGIVDSRLPTVSIWSAKKDAPQRAEGQASDSTAATNAEAANAAALATSGAASADAAAVAAVAAADKDSAATPAEAPAAPKNEYGKGVVLYLRDEEVVGVVTWNMYGKMPVARKLIRDKKKVKNGKEVAKLFNLYSKPESHDETPAVDAGASDAAAAAPTASS